ncbi:PREDICTED: AT-rich interactive domain-containing protein 4A [Thamnophis sirtalis]|uniref:AT-rich interactive domain-containing protein 4A n=1 Tax=Thamnophis sirtalis TaxID=35019 RepID=A0A6I9X998_9SAUR|nr:PREDICTED: AT-rich interactive domain-containing protein 4A [Thamnophis sirtalis]XP_013912173.1 PREDICTED: AT-rich interactive domain-containing protein 4A [Thamnophis sirtalis]XP_013912174.1 PREDICTED: AT-rich interactive domain-containing protein 4A [Thamnophis sirtalis]
MKAADEPAYLTVGTDVSAKYRGAFCEAKIKTVKRLVKVKVILKQDNSTQLVQDDQVKGPLRAGAVVETKMPDGTFQEAIISKLTDASWYTVVFDDGDERTLRRTSLCLKGERHFAESETLDQLPLTNPEHFGTPVIGKKSNRGRRSSLPVNEDEKEEETSEEEEEDKRRLNDELLGKIVSVVSSTEKGEWYPALVLSPSCSDDILVKKDQCLVRSFADSKFYSVARKDIEELGFTNSELPSNKGVQEASSFFHWKTIPSNWKMDMREILESSSSDEEDGGETGSNDEEEEKGEQKEEEVVPEEELDPEERDNFLQQLYKFMEDRGTSINKPPVLGYKDLNLFKLFRLVYHQGGCDNIDSGAVWKQIYMDLGIPILNSAASYNVKTAYRKYLYGFEEYCRSANIQFRTIHHNEPKIIIVQKKEEQMEEKVKEEPEMSPVEVQNEMEENNCSSESEKEELEQRSQRGRRRHIRDASLVKKEDEDDKIQDKLKDSNKENKDIEEISSNAEKIENDMALANRKTTPKQKEKRAKQEEESDRESDEEEERSREELENQESEGEECEEDAEPCLTGTKVKVKYGRGKTQKIYEASIKSTENDDGEILYLVHYYGWNVRYDEWVKADRIIWPAEKGGPKKKQKKKAKSKEDSEKDEKKEKEEEKQKGKRGRPPLKSTLLSNLSCGLSKTPNSDSKSGVRSARSSLLDCSPLLNGTEGMPRRQTRRSSGMLDSDRGSNDSVSSDSEADEVSEKNINEEFSPASFEMENEKRTVDKPVEEIAKISQMLKENDQNQVHPLEKLKLEGEESEQVVQNCGNKNDQIEDVKREVEKSPKGKGRKNRTRESSLENSKNALLNQEETTNEPDAESERLNPSSLENKGLSSTSENETDLWAKDKKLMKRKVIEQPSPDKRVRQEGELPVPNIVTEEKANECYGAEECKDFSGDDSLRNENEEMPSLVAESDQRLHVRGSEPFDGSSEENRSTLLKDEDDSMPQIGPETLLCHEVDLDDLDEKDKNGPESLVAEKQDGSNLTSNPPMLPSVIQPNFSVASPLTFSQDESPSIKSESDMTIEVDSVAEESQEGLCENESANGFEASSNCSIAGPEIGEKGQKRPGDNSGSSLAKRQKRTPKRASAIVKSEKNGTGQSSDSEDLPALDSSSKCTPVKHIGVTKPQKLNRLPARVVSPNIKDGDKEKQREKNHHVSPRVYKWTVQLNELDNMNSTERISFLQEKLQDIRKYYMSLKSEVATIDRRRKRLKKKDREVSHTGASMSSGSSDTGMSPSSPSPPQSVLAVECR